MPLEDGLSPHFSGVMLLDEYGRISWCDSAMHRFLGTDVTGMLWHEGLGKKFHKNKDLCFGEDFGAVFSTNKTVEIKLSLKNDKTSLYNNTGQLCLEPVFLDQTSTLQQVVGSLSLTSAISSVDSFTGLEPSQGTSQASFNARFPARENERDVTINGIQTPLVILDVTGRVLDCNDFGAGYLGGKKDELININAFEKLSADRLAAWQQALATVTAHELVESFIEIIGSNHFEVIVHPVLDDSNQILAVMITARDITQEWVENVRYKELYNNMLRGVLICESYDGGLSFLIKEANKAWMSISRTEDSDIVGKKVRDILVGVNKAKLIAAMQRVYSTSKNEHFVIAFRGNHGQKIWLDMHVFVLPNRELVLIIEDITQKYEVEQILRHGKEEWEKTFDSISDIVTIQDPEMRIVRANKSAYRNFNLKYGSLIGKTCYEIFQCFEGPCIGCPVVRTGSDLCTHNNLIYNERLKKTFDVRSSPIFDDEGELKWVVQIARDITDNLEHEAERRLLSAAIEQASESVVITDREGVLEYVNPAFTETTGYQRDEAVGQGAGILRSGIHDQSFYQEMWSKLLAGEVWRGRLTNRKKDGSFFREDATISPVVDSHGEITNYIALKRDITREESLERQLHQAMKMEAIGTLAGGIAHDFNNILSAIIGYTHIAKGKLAQDLPVHEDLDQVLAGGDRAADLVKQILTFARQETKEQFRPLRIQYIVKEVLKLLRSSLPATIELKQNVDSSCDAIMADPGQLHQLLMNLCTNAKQAIGLHHGVITITLKQQEVAESYVIGDTGQATTGKYIQLSIQDTGCGMDREVLERIFDPFFTTRAKEHGTGLGLAVVHGIVKKHGGEIFAESEVGKGTTFHVFFSIVERVREPAVAVQGPEFRGSEHIMVVEDEAPVGRVLESILSKLGYSVTLVTDSPEAVSRLRDNPNCCDLILTDMTMPNLTGLELAREALALRPQLPIIMLTGYSEAVDKEKAVKVGIRDFLLKPVRKDKLSAVIREVLDSGPGFNS